MEQTATLTGAGDSVRIVINPTTPSLFPLLEVHPLIGRLFRDGEGARGQPGLIILSYGLWQERFGGRVEMIGQVVQLDDKPYTIVGVMPRDFAFPDHQSRAWIAWSVPQVLGEGGVQVGVIFRAIARLRAGATPAQASAEATSRARAAASGRGIVGVALFGAKGPIDLSAVPELQAITADVRPAILVLLAAVALLLIDGDRQRRQPAARADDDAAARDGGAHSDRRRAAAHRQAIADRERDCRPVGRRRRPGPRGGTPAMLPVAAACGFSASRCRGDSICARWRLRSRCRLPRASSAELCRPGIRGASTWSRRCRRTVSRRSAERLRSPMARTRALIMAAQVAIACVLLIGAALLSRSFVSLIHADRGYDPSNVLTARLPLPPRLSCGAARPAARYAVDRLRAIPGVTHAAYSTGLPFVSSGGIRRLHDAVASQSRYRHGRPGDAAHRQPGLFRRHASAAGCRPHADGRRCSDETAGGRRQPTFVRQYLGDHPVGVHIPQRGPRAEAFDFANENADWEVVGVVDDMRQDGVDVPPQPEIFASFTQIAPAHHPQLRSHSGRPHHHDPTAYVATLRASCTRRRRRSRSTR